jgi:hypothetical protein
MVRNKAHAFYIRLQFNDKFANTTFCLAGDALHTHTEER